MVADFWIHLLIGMVGALAVALFGGSRIGLEYRLVDTVRLRRDRDGVVRAIRRTIESRNEVRAKLGKNNRNTTLKLLLDADKVELDALRKKETEFNRQLLRIQITSKVIALFAYVLIGGVVAGLLASAIDIAFITTPVEQTSGLEADGAVAAFVIGLTWPTYVQTLMGRHQASVTRNGVEQAVNDLKSEITGKVEKIQDADARKTVASLMDDVEQDVIGSVRANL